MSQVKYHTIPSNHFSVVSTLLSSWCDVATSNNVETTLCTWALKFRTLNNVKLTLSILTCFIEHLQWSLLAYTQRNLNCINWWVSSLTTWKSNIEGVTTQQHPCLGNLIYSFGKMKNKHDFETINLFLETYSIIFQLIRDIRFKQFKEFKSCGITITKCEKGALLCE